MPNWKAYAEADKRGILTPDKKSLYEEAKTRGLTGDLDPQILTENPEIKPKVLDTMVYSKELGIPPEAAYDMNEEITTQLDSKGISFKNDPVYKVANEKTPVDPTQREDTNILAYAPFVAVKAIEGLMSPALPALKVLGMDTQGLLDVAEEYWRGKVPDVNIPDVGIGRNEAEELEFQRVDSSLADMIGSTAELSGFMGPMTAALKAGGLVAEKTEKVARPFYQKILKGMVGGALLGEGDKDKTLQSMALFGVLEGAGYAIAKIPKAAKAIQDSNLYRKATIKERGLMVQTLKETIQKNPNMSQGELARHSDDFFNQAFEARLKTESVTLKPVKPKIVKPIEPIAKTEKPQTIDAIKAKHEGNTEKLFISETEDVVSLNDIQIKEGLQEQGAGSAVMKDLIEYADSTGKRIELIPDPKLATSEDRLKEFYKRWGFVENKGANKDFEIGEERMFRDPKDGRKESLTPEEREVLGLPIEDIKPKKQTPIKPESIEVTRAKLITDLQRDTLLPEVQQLRYLEGVRGIKQFSDMDIIKGKIAASRELATKRKGVSGIIETKKLQKVENLRKALEFPSMKEMSMEELGKFEKVLEPFQESDVFLTQKQLETLPNTDIPKHVKTIREAREVFADRAGIPIGSVSPVKVGAVDRLKYDTALAEKDPFYKVMVEDYHSSMMTADAKFLDFEDTANDLAKKARASRKRTIAEKLIPTDKPVFDYLSSPNKAKLAKNMTPEELDYAVYLEEKFADALEYLITTKTLETGRENYITNIRRDMFETIKDDGIKAAIKEALNQQKLDEQTFDILDQMTGDILPLEKFFQFSIERKGGMTPTKNVAKAASTYFKTFEKKKALDSFMPKMMVFVDALTPIETTETGLLMDQRLKNFVKEWINTKKGRPSTLILKPGSTPDIVTKSVKAFITTMDLGGNIPVGIASTGGELVSTYNQLGREAMAKGIKRSTTAQGKKIIAEHKNFVGKSLWAELAEPGLSLGDKLSMSMFGFFKQSALRSNKINLLGSLTEEEFASGKISPQRLAEMEIDAGRFRAMPGAKSIIGATTEGGLFTHYKSWAVPILSTHARNISKLTKAAYSKSARGELSGKEYKELKNAIQVTGAAMILIALSPTDETGFIGTIKGKIKREALTVLGALDPTLWTAGPRMLQWANEISKIAKELVLLERYSEKAKLKQRGKLKGVERAKKLVTPRALNQFSDNRKKKIIN